DAGAVAVHQSLGIDIERATVAVGRIDATFLIEGAGAVRKRNAGTARERHFALAVEERLAGDVDGDQRGRAGGLDGERRSAQVELVGDVSGDKILVIEQLHLHAAGRGNDVRIGQHVVNEVGARRGAAVDAD